MPYEHFEEYLDDEPIRSRSLSESFQICGYLPTSLMVPSPPTATMILGVLSQSFSAIAVASPFALV